MRVSEEEALTKWCPFARVYAFSVPTARDEREVIGPAATGGPANRYINATGAEENPDNCRCIGSQCMAWIWINQNVVGYCGLVGTRV